MSFINIFKIVVFSCDGFSDKFCYIFQLQLPQSTVSRDASEIQLVQINNGRQGDFHTVS